MRRYNILVPEATKRRTCRENKLLHKKEDLSEHFLIQEKRPGINWIDLILWEKIRAKFSRER